MFKLKRVYEKSEKKDGIRVLVDRLWPRGLSKEKAKIDKWMKEISPSEPLRKWFAHKQEHWQEFKKRYNEELSDNSGILKELKVLAKNETITLLYASKDKERNNACVLFEYLKKR